MFVASTHQGYILDHDPLTKPNVVDLIVEIIVVDLDGGWLGSGKDKWFGFLKCEFHKHLEATKVGDANDDKVSAWLHWTIHHHDVPTFLGGHLSLRNKSAKYVDLLYLEYFRDLEMVYMTSLGRATT